MLHCTRRGTRHQSGIPWVINAMTRDAFRQHARFLRFFDPAKKKRYGQPGFKRLFPVEYLIDHFRPLWQKHWTLGQHIGVDESMIKYKGKGLDFVQFMPKKVRELRLMAFERTLPTLTSVPTR